MKTKPKFSRGDSVRTAVNSGTVRDCAAFADHLEYEIEFPDGTAAWFHESNLKAINPQPPTIN